MRRYDFLTAPQSEIDAAKRLADIVNGYAVAYPAAMLASMWLAVRLSDGNTDGNIYEKRRDAVRHQSDEKLCAYLSLRSAPAGMTIRDAFAFLSYYRAAYDAGFRLPDPDDMNGGMNLEMPITKGGITNQIGQMLDAAARRNPHYRRG